MQICFLCGVAIIVLLTVSTVYRHKVHVRNNLCTVTLQCATVPVLHRTWFLRSTWILPFQYRKNAKDGNFDFSPRKIKKHYKRRAQNKNNSEQLAVVLLSDFPLFAYFTTGSSLFYKVILYFCSFHYLQVSLAILVLGHALFELIVGKVLKQAQHDNISSLNSVQQFCIFFP